MATGLYHCACTEAILTRDTIREGETVQLTDHFKQLNLFVLNTKLSVWGSPVMGVFLCSTNWSICRDKRKNGWSRKFSMGRSFTFQHNDPQQPSKLTPRVNAKKKNLQVASKPYLHSAENNFRNITFFMLKMSRLKKVYKIYISVLWKMQKL